MAKLQRRVSAALLAARRCNVGLHVFPCAVTVLGGFGGQGTRHGIPTDGPNRLNTGQHLIQEFSTPDFALSDVDVSSGAYEAEAARQNADDSAQPVACALQAFGGGMHTSCLIPV